ncbi:dihydroxyacetone kinase subunit DhaL [Sulfobacillus harzensis]|uniref:phosphoenolpyruvate--glycerone phosphotransferase n=1 Tax=Sulfobacillus harzensis TaxID=2729629 RepID=A0A7Y0L382_9FIRM|nr:dihydroxyacetone kinase subunit DhaL [Sulfobacillus harzensis]NMP22258.1 dihydroxyacetone kinase subunit L [Sulfobacillus harzensis]
MTESDFVALWRAFYDKVTAKRDELNQLDAAIGDGDHGTNLARGLGRVVEELKPSGSLRASCRMVGMRLLSTVGGASGALWGSALVSASTVLPDEAQMNHETALAALSRGIDQMRARGKAEVGDKTMMDVWIPAVTALESGAPVGDVAAQAMSSAEATRPLQARRGRAAYLGSRSIGHVDPGSLSTALWWEALAEVVDS